MPPIIADYELLRCIGRGSYGDVWLARGATGIYRAIKIVWRHRFNDPEPYEREFSGLRAFAGVSLAVDSRQLALLHVGRKEEAGFFFYVMELADDAIAGREIDPNLYEPLTFKVIRDQRAFLPAAEVVKHASELLRGLLQLHQSGLVHRDIKPSNIILVDGRPKLADIGLVAEVEHAGSYVGTAGFVPPEGPGTPQADLYSFGKVIYELATGCDRNDFPRLPPNLADRADLADLIELNEVIIKACAPLAHERYTDAAAMLEELQLLEAGKSIKRLRRAETGFRRARNAALVLLALAAVAGTGAYFENVRADAESAERRAVEAELADLTRRTFYAASLGRTQRALENGEYGQARRTLSALIPAAAEPDLRGFEWYALSTEAQGDVATVLRESGPAIDAAWWSPTGEAIAYNTIEARGYLVDPESGRTLRSFEKMHRLAGFTPAGNSLVGSNQDYQLTVWSTDRESPARQLTTTGIHRPLAVNRDKPWLLYFEDSLDDQPHRLAVMDVTTGQDRVSLAVPHLREGQRWEFFTGATNAEMTLAYLVMIQGIEVAARIHWSVVNLATGELVSEGLMRPNPRPVLLSPDGRTRFASTNVGLIYGAYDVGSGQPLWQLEMRDSEPMVARLSPDGSSLAIGTIRQTALIVDQASGAALNAHFGHGGSIEALDWSPDGRRLVSASNSGDLRIWTNEEQSDSGESDSAITQIAASSQTAVQIDPSGKSFLFRRANNEWVLVDTLSLEQHQVLRGINESLWFENNRWWGLTTDRQLVVRDLDDSATAVNLHPFAENEPVAVADISQNGRWIVATGLANQIAIWDRHGEFPVRRLPRKDSQIIHIAINNQGDRLLTSDVRQQLSLVDANTGGVIASRTEPWRPGSLKFSPDDEQIALCPSPDGLQIWRANDLSSVGVVPSHYPTTALAFAPDSRRLVIGEAHSLIRVIDTDATEETVTLSAAHRGHGFSDAFRDLDFALNGKVMVACTRGGWIRVWRW